MNDIVLTKTIGDTTYSLDAKGRLLEAWGNYSPTVMKTGMNATDFDEYVAKMTLHKQQVKALERKTCSGPSSSMWGKVQYATSYARGITSVSTAGHGGFILAPTRNKEVHEAWRAANGQYEEDCHWAAVAITFPDLFSDYEVESAIRTAKSWYPDEYTAATGNPVSESESHVLQQRAAAERNKGKWIVISAVNDNGMVRCIASLDGDRASSKLRTYLVPKDEYALPVGGFVIDEARHQQVA